MAQPYPPIRILPKPKERKVSEYDPVPELESHHVRNAAIITGAVLATGGALALQQRSLLQGQRKTLQRAANQDRASAIKKAYKTAMKNSEDALSGVKKAPTTVDPHRDRLEAKIHENRFSMDFPRPHQPEYPGKVHAILSKIHAPIEGAEDLLNEHGPREGAQKIAAIKNARIDFHVAGLMTAHTDRVTEERAWSAHKKNVVQPFFNAQQSSKFGGNKVFGKGDAPIDSKQPHPYDHWVYDKEAKAVVDPAPDVTAEKHKTLSGATPEPEITPKSAESFRASLVKSVNKKLKSPQGAVRAENKKRQIKNRQSGIQPKNIGLERLVRLIELDFKSSERRDKNGMWSKGDNIADPGSMQYAYHMPMVNPGQNGNGQVSNGNGNQRGRGRPPGSLNKRTISNRQVQQDAMDQQPEVRSHLIRNVAIGAGIVGGGALIAGPMVAKSIAAKGDQRAADKILPKIASGKYLGFAERAEKKGQTVEQAIKDRFNNIKALHESRLANADKWAASHPTMPEHQNPYTSYPYAPPPKKPKIDPVTRKDAAISQAELGKAKAELEAERLARTNDALRRQGKVASGRIASVATEIGDLKTTNKQQADDLKKAVIPPGESQKIKNAVNVIRQRGGETLDDQETKELLKHHSLMGRAVPTIRGPVTTLPEYQKKGSKMVPIAGSVNTIHTGEIPLFDRVSLTSAAKLLGGGDAPVGAETLREHVEFLKHKALNTRGGEIKEIAEKHGMEEGHVAHAMALHTAASEMSIEVPHIPKPTAAISGKNYNQDLVNWTKQVEARNKLVLSPHRAVIADRENFVKSESRAATQDYDRWAKNTGNKADPKKREEIQSQAEENARRSHDRQMASENKLGDLHDRFLKQRLPVGSAKSIAAELMGLARRINDRVELTARPVNLVEFSSYIRDVPIKHLPSNVQADIAKFAKTKSTTEVAHYGMVADELETKADPHNLAAARLNVEKRMSKKEAADEVHKRRETKPILVINDRIVDGHHFLAKAMHGKVTSSLHVIDLTPTRFQMERLQPAMIELGLPLPPIGELKMLPKGASHIIKPHDIVPPPNPIFMGLLERIKKKKALVEARSASVILERGMIEFGIA